MAVPPVDDDGGPAIVGGAADDPLLAFEPEPGVVHAAAIVPPEAVAQPRTSLPIVAAVSGMLMIGAVALAVIYARDAPLSASPSIAPVSVPAAAATGLVEITSRPGGATVTIDGEPRGVTPLRLAIGVGSHVIEATSGQLTGSMPVTVGSGAMLHQHIEFTAPPAPGTADLAMATTDASATAVSSPAPEGSAVTPATPVAAAAANVTTTEANLAVPPVGWVRLTAPIEVEVYENGRSLQPSASGRIRLSPGAHVLQLANAALEFSTTLRVDVPTGRTITQAVKLPNGRVSINALPWANVSVDERSVGITPVGDLSLPIGRHEVIWRHPQFGERRQMVTVTERSPVGVGMDFTK